MAESNLARSLFSGNNPGKSKSPRKKSSDPDHESIRRELSAPDLLSSSELQELQALRQEVIGLRQHHLEKELLYEAKNSCIEQLASENRQLKQVKSNQNHTICLLQAQLNQSESTAQALVRSLDSQLKHNWEQRQHELIASVSKMRSQDKDRLASQEVQIDHLQHQKKLLESNQQELIANLEIALLELAENSKIVQKLQSRKGKQSEPQLANHLSIQTTLQQFIKSLESDYASSQKRAKDLEREVTELQEQILKQVGQAAEYEAAIQHWKEKCVIHQNHAIQLSSALERLLDGKDSYKAEYAEYIEVPENEPQNLPDNSKVDLPAFVVRQSLKTAN